MRLSAIDYRIFAAIAETGGITAAANRLGLNKSFVSRALAAMEESLGTRLVQRTTRRLCLTETGETLAACARRIVEEMENAEAAIEASSDAPRGDLKVTAPFSILRFVIAPRIGGFRNKYPSVRLYLDATMRIVDLVEEGIDLAIRIGDLQPSTMIVRRLATAPVVLVASPSYVERRGAPQEPEDLAAHDVANLKRDLSSDLWTLTSKTRPPAKIEVTPVAAVHDPGILLDLALNGVGVAPMPELYARAALADGKLVRVLGDYVQREAPINALYPSRRILAPKVRAFVDFAAEAFASAA